MFIGGYRFICSVVVILVASQSSNAALPRRLADELRNIWRNDHPLNDTAVAACRQEAWGMFDKGFTNYMTLAFPKDNLLPISCKGENWQGGLAVTLLDSLDSLIMMGRLSDMRAALPLIQRHVDFNKSVKVHVFEVVIRVVGGLLSAHSLLSRAQDLIPEYDNTLLELAKQLTQAMLPAFNTPSGLPWMFTNLQTGPVTDVRTTCTACVGTLLLEYGTLSALSGDPTWRHLAEHAATALFTRRSSLGLVGSSLDVSTSTWVSREATIGPGSDSFYEYMLKSYLVFGNRTHLDMFCDLYTAAMRHLQIPGTLKGYAFLADVHMDSGRMARPYVSSLGAFWPGMQALIGQLQDAVDLHANFTAAWQTFGWLPELFTLDLAQVHPNDPGYNLRPEHIESTYLLFSLTGDRRYQQIAARMQRTLQATNSAKCGYASVSNVETGEQHDMQESFFLSETVKYLYLTFSPHAQHLLDYFVLSTEGHLLPTFLPTEALHEYQEEADLQQILAAEPPPNCARLCRPIENGEQVTIEAGLRSAFPLLSFRREDARVIKRRRCIACAAVTAQLKRRPPLSLNARMRIMQLTADLQTNGLLTPNKALAQLVCILRVSRSGLATCHVLRPLMPHDLQHGLPHNAVVLQLTWLETTHTGLVIVSPLHPQDQASLYLTGSTATFGASLVEMTPACRRQLFNVTWPWMRLTGERRHGIRHCQGGSQSGQAMHPPSIGSGGNWWEFATSYWAYTPLPDVAYLMTSSEEVAQDTLHLQDQSSICTNVELHTTAPSQGTSTDQQLQADSDVVEQNLDSQPAHLPAVPDTKDPLRDAAGSPEHKLCDASSKNGSHVVVMTTSTTTVPDNSSTPDKHDILFGSANADVEHMRASRACDHDIPDSASDILLTNRSQSPPQTAHTCDEDGSSIVEHGVLIDRPLNSDTTDTDSGGQQGAAVVTESTTQIQECAPIHTVDVGSLEQDSHRMSGSSPDISREDCTVPDYLAKDDSVPHVNGACKNVPVTWGELTLTSPLHACSGHVANAASIAGTVAVVVRGGGCSVASKALTAQAAGAVGVVVLDLHSVGDTMTMSGDVGMLPNALRIPAVVLGGWHSRLLLEALHDAAALGLPRPMGTLAAEPLLQVHSSRSQRHKDNHSDDFDKQSAPPRGSTTVYMLVPSNSQAFVKANILDRGIDLQSALDGIMSDERVVLMLMQVAKENEATQAEFRTQKGGRSSQRFRTA